MEKLGLVERLGAGREAGGWWRGWGLVEKLEAGGEVGGWWRD